MSSRAFIYPFYTRLIHLALALFGVSAFLSGELAENGSDSIGYLLHSYLGLSVATMISIRIMSGFITSHTLSFHGWFPFSKQQWTLAIEDIQTLMRLKLPERTLHQGLTGLVQALGLIVFCWMSITGTILFFIDMSSHNEAVELIEELHELGESLIPLYLLLHIGAVIMHSLVGNSIWQRMFSIKSK